MNVYLLHNKNEALDAFKVFKDEVENQCGKQIKIVRLDRGRENIKANIVRMNKHMVLLQSFFKNMRMLPSTLCLVLQIIMVWQKEGTKHYWTWYGVCLATPIFLNPCGMKH